MAYNTSIMGYADIRKVLDRALETEKGVQLRFPDEQAAMTFKGRVHSVRYLDRKENKKIYGLDDPMHGRSVYDGLMTKTGIKKDGTKDLCLVAVIKLDGVEFDLEEIK